jgi:hypothetical protein
MKNIFLLMAWALVLCTAPVHLRAEVVVSVLYFENLRGDMETQWISKGIADSLISDLSQIEGLAIVEREELQNVIEEQQLAELLRGLQRRLAQRPFLTYGEMVQKAASRGATAEQLQRIAQEHPALLRGNTPAEVAWNIQIVMGEIAMRSVSYFEDRTTADRMYGQIIGIARKVRPQFRDDPFLPEILYQEMLARSFRGDWPGVKTVCEEIMTGWPDFRMNYAVEEYYERALDNMGR